VNSIELQHTELDQKERLLKEGRYFEFISLHSEPEFLAALQKVAKTPKLSSNDYWKIVRHAWALSKTPTLYSSMWMKIFQLNVESRQLFMTPREYAWLYERPAVLNVYRGCINPTIPGISWTTIKCLGRRYPKSPRLHGNAHDFVALRTRFLLEGQVEKEKVIAYLNGRGETEVIVPPDSVVITSFSEMRNARIFVEHGLFEKWRSLQNGRKAS
jgi:hypothetical protein